MICKIGLRLYLVFFSKVKKSPLHVVEFDARNTVLSLGRAMEENGCSIIQLFIKKEKEPMMQEI